MGVLESWPGFLTNVVLSQTGQPKHHIKCGMLQLDISTCKTLYKVLIYSSTNYKIISVLPRPGSFLRSDNVDIVSFTCVITESVPSMWSERAKAES